MRKLRIRIILETLGLAGLLSLLFLLINKSFIALGIFIGAATAVVCFQLLSKDVLVSTSVNLQKIKPYFFLKYLARYAIMGVVLFLCAKVGLRLFLGAAFGLLLIYLPIFKQCRIPAK